MKKNAKAFLAILFSAVLVFEAWGGTSVISDTATSTQKIANTTTEDGTAANSDVSVSSNYYVEPLTDANALAVASDTPAVLALSKEDGTVGTAMPETIDTASAETDYYIETLEQFNSFQEQSQSNTFAGLTVHLAANIELDGDFAGIGSAEVPFAGTFNGHGYTITKLSSTTNGLFVAVEGATIQNLGIGNAKVELAEAASNVGILAGTANGATVDNVVIASSKITSDAVETSAIGGMFGKVSGAVTVTNSDVKRLTIKTAGMTSAMGGFVGQADATVTMSASDIANSYVRSTYSSTEEYVTYLGGVVGYATAAVTATDVNAAAMNVTTASLAKGMGTIAGYLTGAASSFEGCDVTVTKIATTAMNDTTGNEINHIGGFAGCVDSDSAFVDCHVAKATLNPKGRTNNLGGFIGSTRSEVILEKPVSGAITADKCTVTDVTAKTGSNRACGKVGGFIGLVGEGVNITNGIVDGFTGPQNTNSSDVGGFVGNVYATDGAATVVASSMINNVNISGKNYVGAVIGRSTATNATLDALYYTNATLNQPTVGNVYTCEGAVEATAEALASGEIAWSMNTINGTVANTLTWTQGETAPEYVSGTKKATVRVAFTQPSGTEYRYTDATGNVVVPTKVDANYTWPEDTYFVVDTVVNAAFSGNIGTAFPVPMNSAPTAAEYSIKTKEQLESFQAASMEYDFTGITIHMLSDIDWGGEEGGDWLGIGLDESLPFTGTFDGHGYAIRNLYSTTTGLFYIAGSTENPVTIKNFTLENANISGESNTALVVATIYGAPLYEEMGGSANNDPNQILNVNVVDSVVNATGDNCGIIIGGNTQEGDSASVVGCTISGTTLNCAASTDTNPQNYGMIAGFDASMGLSSFKNCTVENSKITAANCCLTGAGMVVGKVTGRTPITGCSVTGCDIELTYATTGTSPASKQIGGIAGVLNSSRSYCVDNTVTDTTITTNNFSTSMGLGVGQVNGGLVQNLDVVGGSITTTYNATADQAGRFGGVVGAFGNVAAKLFDCTSTGVTITSASRANSIGGLIGGIEKNAANSLVNGCTSTNFTANMTYSSNTAHAYHMGGAIGRVMAKTHITDTAVSNAAINTNCLVMCVGGFVGFVSGDYASVISDCEVNVANIIQASSAATDSKKNFHMAGFAGCVDSGAKLTGCSVKTVRIQPQGRTMYYAGLVGSTESKELGTVKSAPIVVKSCSVSSVNMDPKNNRNCNECAGLVGRLTEGSSIEDCYVSTITASRNGNNEYIGGLVGWLVAGDGSKTTIKNCYVEGCDFKAKNTNLAGYIVGVNSATNGSFSNLYNYNVKFTGPTAYDGGVQGATASADNVTNGSIVTALNVDNNKAWTQGTSSPVLGSYKGTTELKMLNYNIYFEIVNDTYYITDRRMKVIDMIQSCVDDYGVNVIALQEVRAQAWHNHITNFVNDNSNWSWTGYGRYGSTFGGWGGTDNDSYNLILFNTDVYSKVAEGHFWLSDTPDYESYDIYHCYNKRCVNWVELKDKTTGKSFVVVDQHLEETVTDGRANDAGITLTPEDGPTARINQATLICNRMADYVAAGTPVILAGDFNSAPGQGDAYETIIGRGYQCTRDYAQVADTHGAYTAFNRTDVDTFAKGDHIFTSANCTATLYDVLSDEDIDAATGYHISDHCPIIATIQY